MIARFTLWLARLLAKRQWQESSFLVARQRDHAAILTGTFNVSSGSLTLLDSPHVHTYYSTCICGDPLCELPWQDGGRTVSRKEASL